MLIYYKIMICIIFVFVIKKCNVNKIRLEEIFLNFENELIINLKEKFLF